MRTVTDEERRARLVRRHLVEPAEVGTVEELIDRLVVLHATDPATIYLSVAARRPGVTVDDVDDVLFTRRLAYRTLAMRRTLFVATVETGPLVEASSAPAVAARERRRLMKFMAESGWSDPEHWIQERAAEVLDALDTLDDPTEEGLSARQLSAAVPGLAERFVAAKGTRSEVEMTATSRVLGLMAVDGLLIRGRPSGRWTGRQYTWHRRDRWWPAGEDPKPEPGVGEDRLRALLLERYLARFGPVTVTDLVWWTGWTKTATRAALSELDTVEVVLEGASAGDGAGELGHLLAEDAGPVEAPGPRAALLPALDPTAMGWKQRTWYVGGHQGPLFDRNGNVGPTVWIDGRIVGAWGQRPDGEVVVELLEEVGSDHWSLIEAELARIQRFVGQTVVKPSFPTPLQRRLATP